MDFKLKSLEEWVAQQSSQNQTEQPPDKAGAGWLFIAAAFPDGKWPSWTHGPADTFTTAGFFGSTVTLLEQEMLTPRSETNLSQRRRSHSLAGKYLLEAQRDFSHNFHGFAFSIRESKFRTLDPS